jgi:hypothetical protein
LESIGPNSPELHTRIERARLWELVQNRTDADLSGTSRMTFRHIQRIASGKTRPKKWREAIDWLVVETGVADFALATDGGRMMRIQALYEEAVQKMEGLQGVAYAQMSRLALSYLREAREATQPVKESIEKQSAPQLVTLVVNAMNYQEHPRLRNALQRPTVPGLGAPITIEAPVVEAVTDDGDNGQHAGN